MVLCLCIVQSVLVAQPINGRFHQVDQESLTRAMKTVLKKDTGTGPAYDPTATTNGIRYQTDVIIYLLENGARQDNVQPEENLPLLIFYKDWYEAFRSVNCQKQKVPEYVEKANEFKQNIVIDYNWNKVISEIYHNEGPDLAANITLYWESEDKSFSYEDGESKPPLEVINERVITYRLLKYIDDNLIVCDRIKGLKGRALKGFLKILGKADMTQYRIVPVKDGPQYVLMQTKKFRWFLALNKNLTIGPDGETLGSVPDETKQILHRKIKIQYSPLEKG